MQRTRRGTVAWAQVLSQLERNEQAVAILDDTFGTDLDPEIQLLRDRLASGESVPFSMITSPRDGVAEGFFSLGQALANEAGDDYLLLYARVANALNPGDIDALIMSAEVFWADEFQSVHETVFDQYQNWKPREYNPDSPVRVIDIDDRSLAELGQWPWPRTYMAEMLRRLTNAGAVTISV